MGLCRSVGTALSKTPTRSRHPERIEGARLRAQRFVAAGFSLRNTSAVAGSKMECGDLSPLSLLGAFPGHRFTTHP